MGAQLALYEGWTPTRRPRAASRPASQPPLCARCRAREARYGFRDEAAGPLVDRPRTLCFECFREEIARRRAAAQARLPLEQTLESLRVRRRRAQIAARHALAQ